ncbi:META domain-containing protein [Vibrio maerlii]|uniref:META domain-containing protein n=1 Tax=Vibrio maerlii TaxID=2231648 RepID=UPI000E3C509E|nr:META domain-containing protein [Vibrio maerlii]
MKFTAKKALVALSLPLFMAACTNQGNTASAEITATDLQHHNWQLTHVDGNAITVEENFQAPNLEVGEKMTANGNAGCNNYFGQGELEDGKFRIKQMGMTMKMCPDNAMQLEQAMSATLSDWADMTLTKDGMTLSNDVHTLTFKLRDWVN